jgi:hypothetical protein
MICFLDYLEMLLRRAALSLQNLMYFTLVIIEVCRVNKCLILSRSEDILLSILMNKKFCVRFWIYSYIFILPISINTDEVTCYYTVLYVINCDVLSTYSPIYCPTVELKCVAFQQ